MYIPWIEQIQNLKNKELEKQGWGWEHHREQEFHGIPIDAVLGTQLLNEKDPGSRKEAANRKANRQERYNH